MTEYNVDGRNEIDGLFWRYAPPIAGVLLVALFVSLGFWQLDRASGKIAVRKSFEEGGGYLPLVESIEVADSQRISAEGRFIADRQFLLENIIANGRLGYYVITAFEIAADQPLLLVNRGWIAASTDRTAQPDISVAESRIEIRGRAGRLPRVGIRSGEAFSDDEAWPRLANYPQVPELSLALGRELLPFVLLLDPDESQPLLRQWQPREQGPMMHYGYAFQWFAMAVAILSILVWQWKKKRKDDTS